jgi:uncharacterized protein YqeY
LACAAPYAGLGQRQKDNTTEDFKYQICKPPMLGQLTASPYPAIIFAMTLKTRLQDDLKAALKAGDKRKLAALRLTLSSIKLAETAESRQAHGDLSDEEALAILQTEVKRRRDTIAELETVDRPELLADEKAELKSLLDYLPKQLSREQIAEVARAVIAQTGATGPAQTGAVMKQLVAQLKGQADGRLVNEVVRELLSAR